MKPSLSVQKPVNAPAGVVSAQGIAKYHTQRSVYDGYGYHRWYRYPPRFIAASSIEIATINATMTG